MASPYDRVGTSASAYVDVRPAYPVVDSLVADNVCDGQIRIADIGAGTGIFTAQLVEACAGMSARIDAIEPSPDMRAHFNVAGANLHEASAENTGLADNDVDLVTFAQSWHWVDAAAASAEAGRILRAGGTIALLFNQMDVSIPWVKRLTRIMRSGDVHRRDRAPALAEFFTQPKLDVVAHRHYLRPDDVLRLGTTRSSWISSSPERQVAMQNNLRWYLYERLGYTDEHLVEIPYLTFVWTATRVR